MQQRERSGYSARQLMVGLCLSVALLTGCSESENEPSNNIVAGGGAGPAGGGTGTGGDAPATPVDIGGGIGSGGVPTPPVDGGGGAEGGDAPVIPVDGDTPTVPTVPTTPVNECTDVTHRGVAVNFTENVSEEQRKLFDGCTSDTDYVEGGFELPYGQEEHMGVLIWLAEGSGLAEVGTNSRFRNDTRFRAIQSANDVAAPVYIRSGDEIFSFHSLDASKPVKVTEVRLVKEGEDVSDLRKLRFNTSARYESSFVGINGDVRARVTAEIADIAGAVLVPAEGWGPDPSTCGYYRWIDATGEMPAGLVKKGEVVWVNFDRVSNAEIAATMRESWQAGEDLGYFYYQCTPADDSLADQDWLAKAAGIRDGSYDSAPQIDWR